MLTLTTDNRHELHYSAVQMSGHFMNNLRDCQGSFFDCRILPYLLTSESLLKMQFHSKPLNDSGSSIFRESPQTSSITELRMAHPNHEDKSGGCPHQTIIQCLLIKGPLGQNGNRELQNSKKDCQLVIQQAFCFHSQSSTTIFANLT